MLTENDVVASVAVYIAAHGYTDIRVRTTSERGIDVEGVHSNTRRRLLVEAKGGTSSKPGTNRFGQTFTTNQARSHVAVALFKALELQQKYVDQEPCVALAFPDDVAHTQLVAGIEGALSRLNVPVFFVGPAQAVRIFGVLPSFLV